MPLMRALTAMEETAHILVVDDDTRIRQLLSSYLRRKGFLVSDAADAAEARQRLQRFAFDVIVLDIMMPGENGLDLLRNLRSNGLSTPVLLLSALDQPKERLEGLRAGGDDYMVKPFEPEELLIRLRSLLSRQGRETPRNARSRRMAFGACIFDPDSGELRKEGMLVHLTSREREILRKLAENAGRPVPREDLLPPGSTDNPRTIDVQITRLRRKVELDPARPEHLRTIRGEGYVLLATPLDEEGEGA